MQADADGERCYAVFSITGSFDPIAASRLRARVAELPRDARVVLDFGRAFEVADLALAVLAGALASPGRPRPLLRGLGPHQERMLRSLGVDAAFLGNPGSGAAEERVG
jgi:hypothetical protein